MNTFAFVILTLVLVFPTLALSWDYSTGKEEDGLSFFDDEDFNGCGTEALDLR